MQLYKGKSPYTYRDAVRVCLLLRHDGLAEISGNTPAQVVQHIMAIAPSETIQNSIVPPLANTQLLSAISELNCPICLSVLRWPIQLPCERLVCARCLTEWIHLRGSFCPYCYDTSPLECTQLKPASRMVQRC